MSVVIGVLGWLCFAVIALYVGEALLFGYSLTAFCVLSSEKRREWLKPRWLVFLLYSPFGLAWKRLTNDYRTRFDSTTCGEWTFIPPCKIYRTKARAK